MISTDFESVFLQSLGWALVHAVWQIIVLALLLALILPRLQSAHQRYWAAFGTLFSAFGAFILTFAWIFSNKYGTVYQLFPRAALAAIPAPDFAEIITGWLEAHTNVVVLCWLLGFTVSLFRLLGGMYYLRRLQHNGSTPAVAYWQEKLGGLARQLGLLRPIELLESALIRSPMTLGYFKPIIFFPLGLLNQLSAAEAEAILAHELAHIARRDWLFNLIQAFIETLFYFHPAMWWISAVVRTERENCCDDTAVRLTGNRVMLAKALLHLQQINVPLTSPVLALGVQGQGNIFHRFALLTRIQRILNQPSPQKSLIMEKFVATVFLLGVLATVGLQANGSPRLEAFKYALTETSFGWLADLQQSEILANDSLPKPPRRMQKVVREEDGKRVEMEVKDGKVTRLNIDGREIPENELVQHRALTRDLMHDIPPPPPPPPPPPVPPVPPVPGIPPVPPVPPTPSSSDDEGMGFHFYDAQAPVSRLSTTKDAEGNTLIWLDRGGKPVEIKVKNGEVWVDGQRVENEGVVELPNAVDGEKWINFGQNGNFMLYEGAFGGDGNFYKNGDGHPAIAPFQNDMDLKLEAEMELDRARLMYEREGQEYAEKDHAKQEKAMQKAEKELQKAHKEMEKQHRMMEEQQRQLERSRADRLRQRSAQ